jgi:Cu/Ag efflux protein CusF
MKTMLGHRWSAPAFRLGTVVAQDPVMLKSVKAGDKMKFDAEDVNGQAIVAKIEKSK